MTSSPRNVGILQIVLSGVGFGLLGVLGKAAYAAGLGSGENLAVRFLASSALLFAGLAAFDRSALRLSRALAWRTFLMGALGYSVFSSCYFAALEGLSVSLTVLLLYTFPVIVPLLERVALKTRIPRRAAQALPVVMLGLVALVGADLAVKDARYVALGLASAVLYSIYILVSGRALRGMSPIAAVALIQLFAGLSLAAVYLGSMEKLAATGAKLAVAWPYVALMAVFATAAPMVLFIAGLQKLSASEVSLLSVVEPLTGIALAGLWFGETLSPVQWVGGGAIVLALIWVAGFPRARRVAAAVAFVAMACFATAPRVAEAKPAAKLPAKKARKNDLLAPAATIEKNAGHRIGIGVGLGFTSLSYEEGSTSVTVDGPTLAVGGTFDIGVLSFFAVTLSGGFQYADFGGSNDVTQYEIGIGSVRVEVAPMIELEPVRVGGFVAYDYGVFGATRYELSSGDATSRNMEGSGILALGARVLYGFSAYVAAGADFAMLSGSWQESKATNAKEAAKPAAANLSGVGTRLVFAYTF